MGFDFDEPAGSETIADTSGMLIAEVLDPAKTLLGDGLFHGDGVDNGVHLQNNDKCLKADRALILEARVLTPATLGDDDSYVRRIFYNARMTSPAGNYQLSLYRDISDNNPGFAPPPGTGSFQLNVRTVRNGGTGRPTYTDYDLCPIVADHWYRIRAVWNSDKTGGLPSDLFVDDQGTDGAGLDEGWIGFINCTDADQSESPENAWLIEGDEIQIQPSDSAFGVKYNDKKDKLHHYFDGSIDWIAISAEAESGVSGR